MASATAVLSCSSLLHRHPQASLDAFTNPLKHPARLAFAKTPQKANPAGRQQLSVDASSSSMKQQAVVAAALVAAMVIPEIAEAAQPGVSPSLKNFLLSILSGGVVIGAIIGVVIGVSNFDPVKRT